MQASYQSPNPLFVETIPGKVLEIAAAKSFTHPTRLAAAWEPGILEIYHPSYSVPETEIQISVFEGSTRSFSVPTRNLLKTLYRKQLAPLRHDEDYLYDCRYDTDKNIAHILAWMLPPALLAKRFLPNLKVIVRAKPSAMIATVLELLELPMICSDRDFYGKIVAVPDGRIKNLESHYPSLFGNFNFAGYHQQTPARVFISRKGQRSLTNEQEIEEILQEYGFQKFYYEDIPIHEQWSITRNASCIVALHGAALSSLVFNRQAVKLIELFHPGYVVNMYRHLANAVGGTWSAVTGQITADVIEDLDFKNKPRQFALRPTKIDARSLRMALEHLQIDPL